MTRVTKVAAVRSRKGQSVAVISSATFRWRLLHTHGAGGLNPKSIKRHEKHTKTSLTYIMKALSAPLDVAGFSIRR
eukprot:s121_g30.t1